jgi:hypothetical protein
MTRDQWLVLFEAGPVADVRAALDTWRESRPERQAMADDAFRLDLIHTSEGDRLRVLVNGEQVRGFGLE